MASYTTASALGLTMDGTNASANDAKLAAWAASLNGPAMLVLDQPGSLAVYNPPALNIPNPAPGNPLNGTYNVTAVCGIVIEGLDPTVSNINFTGTTGLVVNYSSQQHSFTLRKLTLTAQSQNDVTAVTLNQSYQWFGTWNARSQIERVVFRGSDGYAFKNYFATCLHANGVSNIGVDEVGMYGNSTGNVGNGIVLQSEGLGYKGPNYATNFDLTRIRANFINMAFILGDNIQSVCIDKAYMFNGQTGLWVPPGVTGQQDIKLVNSTLMVYAHALQIDSPVPNLFVCNNEFLVGPGYWGVRLAGNGGSTINSNQFACLGPNTNTAAGAVLIGGGTGNPTTINDNTFASVNQPVYLVQGTSGITVQGNSLQGNTHGIQNYGSGNITQ